MLALYNVILSLTMTKSKDLKPLLTMPSVMVQENNSRFVGKAEVNRGTLALRGGLRILRGFCYMLLVSPLRWSKI
jgi:hypothetical protein